MSVRASAASAVVHGTRGGARCRRGALREHRQRVAAVGGAEYLERLGQGGELGRCTDSDSVAVAEANKGHKGHDSN